MSPHQILRAVFDGLITEAEAHAMLEALQIRGGFDQTGYTGYDYRNQTWIEETW